MRTIKRNVTEIAQIKTDYTKYFNQFEFKGIVEDNNIFAIDQNSCRDAQNMYVSFEDRLKSRPTLQKDNLPVIMQGADYFNYELVNIEQFGSNKVYIFKSPLNTYSIVYVPNNEAFYKELSGLTKYTLTSVEHYVICFNNNDAKVIDTNKQDSTSNTGWKSLSEYAYIPTTEITTGSSTTKSEDDNVFINKEKHQYNWSNSSRPQLPSGDAEVVLQTVNGEKDLGTFNDININTDYRIIQKLNRTINGTEKISAVGDILCLAYTDYMLLSFNAGVSFNTVYYDEYNGAYLNVATLSDDGQYFFYLASDGVHRYNLSTGLWNTVVNTYDDSSMYTNIMLYRFLTGDVFAFVAKNASGDIRLYVKGPGVYVSNGSKIYDHSSNNSIYKMAWIDRAARGSIIYNLTYDGGVSTSTEMLLTVKDNKLTVIYDRYILQATDDSTIYLSWIDGKDYSTKVASFMIDKLTTLVGDKDTYKYVQRLYPLSINSVDYNSYISAELNHIVYTYSFYAMILMSDNNTNVLYWHYDYVTYTLDTHYANASVVTLNFSFTYEISTRKELKSYTTSTLVNYYPKKLEGGFLDYSTNYNANVYGDVSGEWTPLNLTDIRIKSCIVTGDTFYLIQKGTSGTYNIYTNKLYTNSVTDEEDIARIVYTVTNSQSDNYTSVPQVSYADTELYLGFNKLLQITRNRKDENNELLFYLPVVNNQSFLDNITGMINISTTEVALFFKNNVIICSKVADENISTGYRYDYYNTKLSVGTRLGDSIINTIEGQYTIFPTQRGLAIMNYQAFMATTDQVVEYVTDNVSAMWSLFYENSSRIKITQWRTYLVITNTTGDMLLYNLSNNSWWRWHLPVDIEFVLTDQERLRCISKELLVFKDQKELTNNKLNVRRYGDFSETQVKPIVIDWYITSQPLHFDAPTYYKNIKQLVFQFYDIDERNIYDKTFDAQIKLYRKKITIKEPETVDFKIEGLRTFVKRFNYWKINELQWALSNDTDTTNPAQFEINNINIKYEIGEQVR